MKRFALILAFFVAGIGFLLPKISDEFSLALPQFLQLTLYLPAVLLGTRSWLATSSYARTWPVVFSVLVAWIGLLYGQETESKRAYLIAAYVTIPLPVAALVVEQRAWRLCARTFILASVVALALTVWFEYDASRGSAVQAMTRIGYLVSSHSRIPCCNPNRVGGQFAIASVLALALYLQGLPRHGHPPPNITPDNGVYLASGILLAIGFLLTASRGAFVAWFVGAGSLFLFGTKGLAANRLRDLVALASMLLALGLFASNLTDATPWGQLQSRLVGDHAASVGTIGNRTQIWQDAFELLRSSPTYALFGTGTAMTEKLLAEIDQEGAVADQHGDLYRSPHNVFIEWLTSFGLLGAIPAMCMLIAMLHRARELDVRGKTVARVAILLTVGLYACTAPFHRHSCWLAPAALILAMLSPPPQSRPQRPGTRPLTAREPSGKQPVTRDPCQASLTRTPATSQGLRQSPHRPSRVVSSSTEGYGQHTLQ